jgi:large subunit ribosomal protein L1
MDKAKLTELVKKARENSKKRNFSQTFDAIFVLKGLGKQQKVDFFLDYHFPKGKPVKICALIGPELKDQAKANCQTIILHDDFIKYAKDKKMVKKLANQHDFFIAQGNLMADVAKTFGRILGTRGKMPNPKAGCVVPPSANLKALITTLNKRVRVQSNKDQIIQLAVGAEDMPDDQVADNVLTLYNAVMANLPSGMNNYKKSFVKLTMGKPVEVKD